MYLKEKTKSLKSEKQPRSMQQTSVISFAPAVNIQTVKWTG